LLDRPGWLDRQTAIGETVGRNVDNSHDFGNSIDVIENRPTPGFPPSHRSIELSTWFEMDDRLLAAG
jgi:hypothetical protein